MGNRDSGVSFAAIIRFVEASVKHVDSISVLWIGIYARVIPGTLAESTLFINLRPRPAAVIGTKHSTVFSFDYGPQAIRIGGRHRDTHDSDCALWQSLIASDLSPRIAAVRRFENAA